jgi:hypothetical protein
MTTNIDALVDKIILNKYYEVWKTHPRFNKQKSFWCQFYDLYIADEVEGCLIFGSEKNLFTEEQINSIGWEERFEMIRFTTKHIRRAQEDYDNSDDLQFRVQYLTDNFHSAIIKKNWKYIFDTYSAYYASYHFSSCSNLPYQLFKMVLADFKFKTAIAKVKRNKLYRLGLSMKLSMRDCGIELTPISQKLLDEN